ncbi:MAG: amidohydrolase family protein [Burkholderiales bacterium]|nr:amidohydrolase family protein [Burkholderiales bacterium]
MSGRLTSAAVRARLGHPVIDGDGHLVECPPVLMDFLKQAGGADLAARYEAIMRSGAWGTWSELTPEQRRERGIIRRPFWVMPAHTGDRATALLPGLMRSRLDEFGIDFQVIYPSVGIPFISGAIDADMRRGMCRALNLMYAEIFRDHAARITPAATIPMHTPAEAIEELDFAVGTLGLKAAMIAGSVQRPLPAVATLAPELGAQAFWIDPLAIDSAYDYDPVWQRFVDLQVAPATHNNAMGWGTRRSSTNFVYNHVGHFAAAGEAFAKALFLGGVTCRFPRLKVAFLEGGAGWAANLYNDLCEHWEKRNLQALRANLAPNLVDRAELRRMFEAHGDARFRAVAARIEHGWDHTLVSPEGDEAEPTDEFAACGIRDGRDLHDRFVPNFYFGCEADDRMTAVAFNRRINHHGARLKAVFGSDVGHFDVTDMSGVLAEAYELVEDGLLDADDFAHFTFRHAAELHGGSNPRFFDGTAVADAVRAVLPAA